MGDGAHRLDVQDVYLRVSERFGKDALRPGRNRTLDGVVVANVHEPRIDANLAKGDVELIDGTAVQGRRGDELVAGVHQREESDMLGRLPGCSRNGPNAVFKGGYTLLENRDRRVHDA